MNLLSTDNRNLAEIETELRDRIDAQRRALESLRGEIRLLEAENRRLRAFTERKQEVTAYVNERDLAHLACTIAEAC